MQMEDGTYERRLLQPFCERLLAQVRNSILNRSIHKWWSECNNEPGYYLTQV